MPEDTVRFSISLPQHLLQELDERIISQGYASRSELVRDLIRERLVEDKWVRNDDEVIGVLTIAFDHHNRDLLGRIVDAQHGHYVNTICSTHVHLDHDNCLEVIIIQGKASDIEHLSTAIGGIRGVKFARLTRTAKLPD